MQITTHSEQETITLGKEIATKLKGGDVLLLHGDLGAGKTTLVKGIAGEFGLKQEDIVSPTFTLMQIYEIKNPKSEIKKLVHIDTYRLEDEEDLIEIGVEDYLGDEDTICIVEWPEKIQGLLENKKVLNVEIEHSNQNSRVISSDF